MVICSPSLSQQKSQASESMDCSVIPAGQSVTRKTNVITFEPGSIRVYGSVKLSRLNRGSKPERCRADYKLFVSRKRKDFALIKQFSDDEGDFVGVDMVGYSQNMNLIAADFWWAAGDYTGHRPVVYNLTSKLVAFRALNDEISKQLPACDYFEEYVGVSDRGEAIIHIPKSPYSDEGCPDQGKWLFNLHTRVAKRMK